MVFTVFRQMNEKEVQEPAQANASDDAMSTGASTNYQQSVNTQVVEEEKAMVPVYQYVKMQADRPADSEASYEPPVTLL